MTLASTSTATIGEMREFASFSADEQRYIKRSLDVGLARGDAFRLWGHNEAQNAAIRRQYVVYQELKALRRFVPGKSCAVALEPFIAKLVRLAVFDLEGEHIASFAAFRFLYERLLGAQVRPYLPAAFCAAAALPQVRPAHRKVLLQSLSEAAATAPGWSRREPVFFPECIEDAEMA